MLACPYDQPREGHAHWLAIGLAAALTNREVRQSLLGVFKAFLAPKVLGVILALAGWTVVLCLLGHALGLWESGVLNDTVLWFPTVGMAFLFSLERVTAGRFLRRTAKRAVGVTALVEGFANLETFGLGVELVFVPTLIVLGAMLVISEGRAEYAPARSCLSGLQTVAGWVVLLFVAVRLGTDFEAAHTARALALPVWLTIGTVPFIYALALVTEYEKAFVRIGFHTDDPSSGRRAKRALLRAANVSVRELGGFGGHWIGDLASASTDAEARVLMKRWRATWREERRSEALRDAHEGMEDWHE